MPETEIAVVGAGLAGLCAALSLARRGRAVTLIDRKPALDHRVHTTGIFVRRTLEDFHIPEHLLGPPVRHVVLYSPRARAMRLESKRPEFRVGRMGAIYNELLERCRGRGVETMLAARLERVEPTSSGAARLHLSADGAARTLDARLVIGADGARSRVAESLGLSRNTSCIVGVEDVYESRPTPGPPAFHCHISARLAPGYLAWVIDDGAETHIGVGGYAKRFDPAAALNTFTRRVGDRFGVREEDRVERRAGLIPVGGVRPRIACRHGLLVGDAAGAVSPLTAGGLDPCFRLSAHAAEVADAYLTTGDERTLDAYDGRRMRTRFISRLWMRRALSLLQNDTLCEAACAVMRTPPVRPLAHHVFFGRGSFPDPRPVAPMKNAPAAGRVLFQPFE